MVFLLGSGLLALDRQIVQNFDDQDDGVPPTGWTVGTQVGQLGDWQVEVGELKIEGAGAGSGGGGREVWIWYDRTFSGDITIEYKVKWLASPADGVGRHGGIAFFAKFPGVRGSRYAGMTGYTVDWIDRAADHGVRCHKWTNGTETGLLPDGLFADPDPPEQWRIEVHGDTMSIFLNDQFFQDVQDSSLRDGYIGFWQWENNVNAHYDDLVITNPDLVVDRDVPDSLVNGTSASVKLSVLPYRPGNVVVKEDLPAGLIPSSASGNGVINARTVQWDLGNISDTTEVTYTLTADPTAVDADLGGSATRDGVVFPISGDTTYTGSPVTALGFIKLWNHLGPLAWAYPVQTADHGDNGVAGACSALEPDPADPLNTVSVLPRDWIVNDGGTITEANVFPFPGMLLRPKYGGDGVVPGGTGARAAGLTVGPGDTGPVVRDRYPVWKGVLTRGDTIDYAAPSIDAMDDDDAMHMSCVYLTNHTGAAIDTMMGYGSDDSIQILLGTGQNLVDVTQGGNSICRGWGSPNEEQNTAPVTIPVGESRLLVKVTDGFGGAGFRLRFQDPDSPDPTLPDGLLPPRITVSLESSQSPAPAKGTRSLSQATHNLNELVGVSLRITAKQPSAVVVKEVLPESATASEISDGGALAGGVIQWSLSNVSDKTVTYKLGPPPCAASAAFGQSTWAIGPVEALIGGESTIARNALSDQNLGSWASVDIGYTGGAAQPLGEHDVVVDAGGAGIKGKEDQFRFIYFPMKGDFELSAQIDCMSESGTLGQAGLMVRDTVDVFSAHAFLALTTGDFAKTGTRILKGLFRRATDPTRISTTIIIADKDVPSLPLWLKLRRAGTKISFFRSSDGVNYGDPIAEKDIGTGNTQVNLREDALVGLATTGSGGRLAATFRSVSGPSFTASTKPQFHRGDSDDNGQLQLTDAIRILGFLFLGGTSPSCLDAADADDNGQLQLTDAIRILGFLFLGGVPPAAPGPPPSACGEDPVGVHLDCASYTHC